MPATRPRPAGSVTFAPELEAQSTSSRSQKDLERRFERQEKERAEQKKAVQEERDRQRLEAELATGDLRHGFHFTD